MNHRPSRGAALFQAAVGPVCAALRAQAWFDR